MCTCIFNSTTDISSFRPDLNLQPLAYLWNRDQSSLLHEMNNSGLDAILIKVAGIELTERDLGRSLRQLTPKLEKLSQLYGAHVCGEGGEYETLCLDSPLFQRRISVDETETILHSDAAFASVSYLRILRTSLIDKTEYGPAVLLKSIQAPPLLDDVGNASFEALRKNLSNSTPSISMYKDADFTTWQEPTMSMSRHGDWLTIADVSAPSMSFHRVSFEDEVRSAFAHVFDTLKKQDYDRTHIAHVNVYLASASYFEAFQRMYCAEFGAAPPSRSCLALPVRSLGLRIKLDVVACRPASFPRERRALHVRSQGYWVPASLGPFSQAVGDHHRIYMSGQIGMQPATLDLPDDVALQLALSVQHQQRIVDAVSEWGACVHVEGGICWLSPPDGLDMTQSTLSLHQKTEPMLFVYLPSKSITKHACCEWQLTARIFDEKRKVGLRAKKIRSDGITCCYRMCEYDDSTSLTSGIALFTLVGDDESFTTHVDDAWLELRQAIKSALHVKLIYDTHESLGVMYNIVHKVLSPPLPATTTVPVLGWQLPGENISNGPNTCALVWT